MSDKRSAPARRKVALALQGGGSHGAFTWGVLDRERFGRVLFHGIEASAIMEKLATSSKLNNSPALLEYLFDLGRKTADAWWADHGGAIGQRSTVDLQKLLPEEYWA